MRPLARWAILPLLAAPLGTWALGLGDIELNSALNQPLDAEIELVSATPDELKGLKISLADADAFARNGIDRPAFLSSLQFEVGRNAAGQNVILVRSNQSITEPFVTMLVRAEWPRGAITREYTVFLDPPTFLPEPAAPAAVEPPQTRAPQETVAGGEISRQAPAPIQRPQPQSQSQPRPEPQTQSQSQPVAEAPEQSRPQPAATTASRDGTDYGPVRGGETLWGIATRYRPAGVTMNQMMLAVYQANPQAFGGNMNLLHRGAILRLPPAASLTSSSVADATAEVRRQEIEWSERRAQPEPRLVLVPPADESSSVVGAGGDAGGSAAELGALRDQVSSLEQQLSESERLLALRDTELADLQDQLRAASEPAEAEPAEVEAEPAPVADSGGDLDSEQLFVDESSTDALEDESPVEPIADEAAPPAEPEPAAAPPTLPQVTSTPQPSLVDRALDMIMSPIALIAGGVLAVLIGAFIFVRRRRSEVEDVTGQWEALEAELDEEEADHAATTRLRSEAASEDDFLVVEEPQDNFAGFEAEPEPTPAASAAEPLPEPEPAEQTMSSQTVINLDQADPIAEADFHMAYGLYDQAADLVSKALEAEPDNRELKLKLLEVFFVWGNKESFLETARSLRAEMGDGADADWDKVVIMGKQICPDEALFAEATAAAGSVDLDLEAGDAPALDLAFKEGDEESVDLDFGTMAEDDMELETTGGRPAFSEDDDLEATGKRERTLSDDDENLLDIGERTSAGLEAALFETDAAGEETSPDVEADSLAVTQESPTVETPRGDVDEDEFDWSGVTMESPTIEQAGLEAGTLESTALEAGEAPTVETPTIETETSAGETREAASGHELTAELDLDALGLDAGDMEGLPNDLGDLPAAESAESDTREQPAIDADDDLLSATGVTQVLRGDDESGDTIEDQEAEVAHTSTAVLGDDEATMMAPSLDATGVTTEVLDQPVGDPRDSGSDEDVDLNLDDFTQALKGGDTVEQPRASSFDTGMFDGGASGTPVDLDVGRDVVGDDEPTGTEEVSPLDPQTMTEVGTKLDLARAYIDMGDPEGAKSILEEVMSEGDSSQRQEAQSLLDALPA